MDDKQLSVSSHLFLDKWIGRLCNNIAQICHAIYLAEQTQSYLEIAPHKGMIETRNFDFTAGSLPSKKISGHFYYLNYDDLGIAPLDWNSRRRILKQYVSPMLPAELFSSDYSDGLTIHIRSGDIFKPISPPVSPPGQSQLFCINCT